MNNRRRYSRERAVVNLDSMQPRLSNNAGPGGFHGTPTPSPTPSFSGVLVSPLKTEHDLSKCLDETRVRAGKIDGSVAMYTCHGGREQEWSIDVTRYDDDGVLEGELRSRYDPEACLTVAEQAPVPTPMCEPKMMRNTIRPRK